MSRPCSACSQGAIATADDATPRLSRLRTAAATIAVECAGQRRLGTGAGGRWRTRGETALVADPAPPAAAQRLVPLVASHSRDGGPRVRSLIARVRASGGRSACRCSSTRCATRMRSCARRRAGHWDRSSSRSPWRRWWSCSRSAATRSAPPPPPRSRASRHGTSAPLAACLAAAAEPELLVPGPGRPRGGGWATAPRPGAGTRAARVGTGATRRTSRAGRARRPPGRAAAVQGARRRRSRRARRGAGTPGPARRRAHARQPHGAAVALRLASLSRDPRARPASRRPRRAEAGGPVPGLPAARAARGHRRAGAHRRAGRARLPAGTPVGAEPRAAARGGAGTREPGRPPEDLPQLASLASDDDWNVRNEAARGLARLPLEESRPLLLTLARDVESVVAVTAREAFTGAPARTWALSS